MDEDKFSLVEKIVKDVDNILSKNAELNSFDIVPVESNFQNKSPVLHLENCLGLESWCVKHVYMYCYSEIMDKYFTKQKRKTLKVTSINSDRLTSLLNVTLLLNPELSSLWNKRREMVQKQLLEKTVELKFTKLVLSRKPKCNEAFSYRRWLLDEILQDESLHSNYIECLAEEDLLICEKSAENSPNNYHSWNHRIWLINKLKETKQFDPSSLFIKEYVFSEKCMSKNISDFSCFHYRQFCIRNIFTMSNESWKTFENVLDINLRKSFVRVVAHNFPKDSNLHASEHNLSSYSDDKLVNILLTFSDKNCNCSLNSTIICRKLEVLFYELVLNNELLRFYKQHETLWYHRRFIIHEINALMYDRFGLVQQSGSRVKYVCRVCNCDEGIQKQAKIGRYDSNDVYSSILFKVVKIHENKFIDERRAEGDNYADRHKKCLKFLHGIRE